MKRTTLMTILAMSLALRASRADMPTGTNKPEEHHSMAKWIQVGAEGVIVGNDADQRQPVRLNLPGNADPEKPRVLIAPGSCQSCIKNPAFSTWEQFRLACRCSLGSEGVPNCLPPRYTRSPGEESPCSSCFVDGVPSRRHIL
jgi:hypothetical protein